MDAERFRVDLTFATGVGTPDLERYGRAVAELVKVLPDGSRILNVGDAGGPGVIDVAVSIPAAGRSSAQALRDVARSVEMAAVAAAGTENLGQCRRAVVERVPE